MSEKGLCSLYIFFHILFFTLFDLIPFGTEEELHFLARNQPDIYGIKKFAQNFSRFPFLSVQIEGISQEEEGLPLWPA